MSKSNVSNEFYQLQSGANRKHYKEFGYAFITDLIKIPDATLPFLMFCVKNYKENIATNPSKASAALFILALCEREQLEAQKAAVSTFCKTELLSLITNGPVAGSNELVRFRAIWIVETYAMFLDKEDIKKVLHYYANILALASEESKESELIKAGSCMALFRYLSEADG